MGQLRGKLKEGWYREGDALSCAVGGNVHLAAEDLGALRGRDGEHVHVRRPVRRCHLHPRAPLYFYRHTVTTNFELLQSLDQDLEPQKIALPDPTKMFKWPNTCILFCYGTSETS